MTIERNDAAGATKAVLASEVTISCQQRGRALDKRLTRALQANVILAVALMLSVLGNIHLWMKGPPVFRSGRTVDAGAIGGRQGEVGMPERCLVQACGTDAVVSTN